MVAISNSSISCVATVGFFGGCSNEARCVLQLAQEFEAFKLAVETFVHNGQRLLNMTFVNAPQASRDDKIAICWDVYVQHVLWQRGLTATGSPYIAELDANLSVFGDAMGWIHWGTSFPHFVPTGGLQEHSESHRSHRYWAAVRDAKGRVTGYPNATVDLMDADMRPILRVLLRQLRADF